MEENLIGYLLNALDPETHVQVEQFLTENAEAQKQLELLRSALLPLESDRDTIAPPAGLWIRTIARVAEHRCRDETPSPVTLVIRSAPLAPVISWYRRADVLVAAGILLCFTMLIPPGVNYARYRHNIVACQDNMRNFFTAFANYSNDHHGELPNVAEAAEAPRNIAGMFMPMLRDGGYLTAQASVKCPKDGTEPACPPLQELRNMDENKFAECADQLGGCYAYSLGYRDQAEYRSPRLEPGEVNNAYLPILADRPPRNVADGDLANSPNHWGRGQNVLFADGHCDFYSQRNIGVNGDDIYLNQNHRVAAGLHRWDAVLAESKARP